MNLLSLENAKKHKFFFAFYSLIRNFAGGYAWTDNSRPDTAVYALRSWGDNGTHCVRLLGGAAGQCLCARQFASDSGYRSYSTFSLAFKQRMGQSVTEWLRTNRPSD